MVTLDYVKLAVGQFPALNFTHADKGDWTDWIHDDSHWYFPFPPGLFSSKPRVVVTGTSFGAPLGALTPAVVGMTANVSTDGFQLQARNTDSIEGYAAFSWIAVEETKNKMLDGFPNMRFGVVQPQWFRSSGDSGGYHGDWRNWSVAYSDLTPLPLPPGSPPPPPPPPALTDKASVVLTANDLASNTFLTRGFNVAAVGLVNNPSPHGFDLSARNSDKAEGTCNFFYLAANEKVGRSPTIWMDTGEVAPIRFSPAGDSGDWQSVHVTFKRSFRTPPVVLVTGTDTGRMGESLAAVVPIARTVTPNGFTLAARSADPFVGDCAFQWIALSCDAGCG